MSSSNFTFKDGVVSFFGAKGAHRQDGRWEINVFGDHMVEVDPSDYAKIRLQGCIEAARAITNVAYAIVGTRVAVTLFLDGTIPEENLQQASTGRYYVDIPDVIFGDLSLTFRVDSTKDCDYFAVANSNCRII